MHGRVPTEEFGGTWPDGLPRLPRERALVTDDSLPAFDGGAAALVRMRVLGFLERAG
jgi:hypothetical protein